MTSDSVKSTTKNTEHGDMMGTGKIPLDSSHVEKVSKLIPG